MGQPQQQRQADRPRRRQHRRRPVLFGLGPFLPDHRLLAGLLLGRLLAVVDLGGLALADGQAVADSALLPPPLVLEEPMPFGFQPSQIGFSEIRDVAIGYQGKKSSFVQTYYLVLKLTTGKDYPPLAPGRFYLGASSRTTVEGWQRRLQEYMAS